MSENTKYYKTGVITGGTQIPHCSRRLKFGPFSKELCHVIGGGIMKSVILADYRRFRGKGKSDLPYSLLLLRLWLGDAFFWKMNISYQYAMARSIQVAHNRFSVAFWAHLNLMCTTSGTGELKTEINNSIARRNSNLMKMS